MSDWKLIYEGGIPDLNPMARSDGPHVSSAIHRMAITRGDLVSGEELDTENEFTPSPVVMTKMQLGNAFETGLIQMLTRSHPLRYFQGFEMTVDGKHGTHDILDVVDRCTMECKVTWYGGRRGVLPVTHKDKGTDKDKFAKYEDQVTTYTYMMCDDFIYKRIRDLHRLADEAKYPWDSLVLSAEALRLEAAADKYLKPNPGQWRGAQLHVVYVNGYYSFWKRGVSESEKENDGPLYRVWQREFTDMELISKWIEVKQAL